MSNITGSKPRVVEIADQILADIRARRLSVGDAYLTTMEAAKQLKVGTAAANKAMQLLVQQGVLKRANKAGCVIAGNTAEPAVLRRVHILLNREHMRTEGFLADGLIVGLQSELAGAQVMFNFLSPPDEETLVRQAISEAMRQSEKAGFILARSSFSLQKQIVESGMPAVVYGTPYRAIHGLASLDRDHAEAGRLLTRRLLDRRCGRVILLMRNSEWPGDFAFVDAIQNEMSMAGMRPGQLRIRHLPSEEEAVLAELKYLLAEEQGITGIIARSEPLAAAAMQLAGKKNHRIIVAGSELYRGDDARGYTYIKPLWDIDQIGAQIGRMLKAQAMGERLKVLQELIPVALA